MQFEADVLDECWAYRIKLKEMGEKGRHVSLLHFREESLRPALYSTRALNFCAEEWSNYSLAYDASFCWFAVSLTIPHKF